MDAGIEWACECKPKFNQALPGIPPVIHGTCMVVRELRELYVYPQANMGGTTGFNLLSQRECVVTRGFLLLTLNFQLSIFDSRRGGGRIWKMVGGAGSNQ